MDVDPDFRQDDGVLSIIRCSVEECLTCHPELASGSIFGAQVSLMVLGEMDPDFRQDDG